MKKALILIITFILIFLTGCSYTQNKTFTFERSTSKPIIIAFDGELTSLTIKGENTNSTLSKEKLSPYIDNNNLVLDYSFFEDLEEGLYTITVFDDNTQSFNVKLSGNLYQFNYIDKKNIFTITDNKYYVVFTEENCQYCKKIKSELIDFNDFLLSYPEGIVPSLYMVNCTEQDKSIGQDDVLTGINNYQDLINNVKISTPTFAIIENGAISSYYIGYSNVSTFLNIETKNISSNNIVHNIDNPKSINILLDFIPKKFSITNSEGKKTSYYIDSENYTEGSTGFHDGIMTFSTYYFNSKLPGNYTLTIYNDDNKYIINLYITSIFKYISIYDLFSMTDSKYYVFFLRDGCPACNYVKPTLLEYSNSYQNFNNENNYPLYAVHESQHSVDIYGEENFIGVSNLDELKLDAFPRVVLIEDGVITNLYKGSDNSIINLFTSLLK